MLPKSFSELLNYFHKLRWLKRGHRFGTQLADSIFQATRFHRVLHPLPEAFQESHFKVFCSIQYTL
jgi:hypothetical protein